MATNMISNEAFQTLNDNKKNVVLMWLDANVNTGEGHAHAQKQFTTIFSRFEAFECIASCEDSIKNISEDTRVVLIVSGQYGQQLVPRIHQLPQVSAIYVFCMDQTKALQWAKNFEKVKRSYSSI